MFALKFLLYLFGDEQKYSPFPGEISILYSDSMYIRSSFTEKNLFDSNNVVSYLNVTNPSIYCANSGSSIINYASKKEIGSSFVNLNN